ncbi:hypothetical protein BDQ17DRAFT_1327538 [Cyathus striatus]|nr:hypothetical protein BDQ17DRAFT_1327538 [Cyathus striatus]
MSEHPVNQDHHNLRSTVMQIREVDTVMNELHIIDMDDPMGLDLDPLAGLVPGAYLTDSTIPPLIVAIRSTNYMNIQPQAHASSSSEPSGSSSLQRPGETTSPTNSTAISTVKSAKLAVSSWHCHSTRKVQLVEQSSLVTTTVIAEKEATIQHLKQNLQVIGHEREDAKLKQEVMISTLKDKLAAAEAEKKVILEQHNSTMQELRLQLETATAERKGQDTRIEGLERSLQQLHAMIENKMAEKQQVAAKARHLKLEQRSIASTSQINPLQHTRVQQERIDGGDVEMADDEDEGGEVCTHGHTYGKGKGKGAMGLNEDENTTNDPTVPPPMRFKRPKGGAGPRWGTRRERVPSERPSPAPHASLGTEDTAHDSSNGPTLQVLLDKMRDLKAQMLQGTRPTHARPLKLSPKFKLPPKRTYDPDRTELLSVVQPLMNLMLGIERDADCKKIQQADDNSVSRYSEGTGEGPTGRQMCPFFGNIGFQSLFQEKRRTAVFNVLPSSEIGLYSLRIQIADRNRKGDNNTTDPFWDFLYHMVLELSSGGMSSDEMDGDRSNGFWVKKCSWRSSTLTNYLSVINKDHNFMIEYGEICPGNLPRVRKQCVGVTRSTCSAIPGLPRNFYDDTWYESLSNRDRRYLDVQDAVDLPEIVPLN